MRTPEYYVALFASMQTLPGWCRRVNHAAELVRSRRDLYEGLPAQWEMVGVIHLMECACDPDRQIINGQRWDMRTTLHPPGLGPWISWREAAHEALRRRPLNLGLMSIEGWNGMGYAKRGKNSPYLWSGSNHGRGVGKFIERNGKSAYDPDAVSQQVGAALVLRALGWRP